MTNPFQPGFGTGQGGTDVNRMHDQDDRDISTLSHHHTLGIFPAQASPGDHIHDGKQSKKLTYANILGIPTVVSPSVTLPPSEQSYGIVPSIGVSLTYARSDHTHGSPTPNKVLIRSNAVNTPNTVEAKDVLGDATFTAVSGRKYKLRYNARVIAAGGTLAGELHIRGNNSAVSPTTASTILASNGVFVSGAGGSLATDCIAEANLACPADIAVGLWTVACFYARIAGAGTTANADQAGSSKREFTIDEVG